MTVSHWVIRDQADDGSYVYWSITDGWVDCSLRTYFTEDERNAWFTLPLGNDPKWVLIVSSGLPRE
jgi:hypothetical protein